MFRKSKTKSSTAEIRAKPYESVRSEDDALTQLSGKLIQDLKRHIDEIVVMPVYSDGWIKAATLFGRIATVVVAEESFVDESKDRGTLWENEGDALRHLVERNKLGVLLRMLSEFKAVQGEMQDGGDTRLHDTRLCLAAQTFEKSICVILIRAMNYSEVVNTLNIDLLTEMICDCFHNTVSRPELFPESHPLSLESAGLDLLRALLNQAESMGEDRVVAPLEKAGVAGLMIQHIRIHHEVIHPTSLSAGLCALGAIVDTEAFQIREAAFLQNDAEQDAFLWLEDIAVQHSTENKAIKHGILPLLDEIRRRKRIGASKK